MPAQITPDLLERQSKFRSNIQSKKKKFLNFIDNPEKEAVYSSTPLKQIPLQQNQETPSTDTSTQQDAKQYPLTSDFVMQARQNPKQIMIGGKPVSAYDMQAYGSTDTPIPDNKPNQESQDPWADFRNSYLNNQSKLGDAQIQQGNNANTIANNLLNFGMTKYNQDASAEQENNLYNRAMNEQSLHTTGMFNAEDYINQHRQPINLNFNQQPMQPVTSASSNPMLGMFDSGKGNSIAPSKNNAVNTFNGIPIYNDQGQMNIGKFGKADKSKGDTFGWLKNPVKPNITDDSNSSKQFLSPTPWKSLGA